jgi:mitofilin
VLGILLVGAATMGAYQAGFIDLQFKDIKLPLRTKKQDDIKMNEDLKAPSEEKVEQKQAISEQNIAIVQETDKETHASKNLPDVGESTPGIPTHRDQSVSAEENEADTLDKNTHSVPGEHGSQDAPAVETKPLVDSKVIDKATHEEQTDKTASMVSPVQSSPTDVSSHHDSLAVADEPKESSGADAVEHKSLAETYLLQDEHDASKDEKQNAKKTKNDEFVREKTSDDGKIVLDIIEAIHAAEKKQADSDAYMFSEEKRKLKEKYEKELKDTRARELMYVEEAAILDKELKKEKMKHAAMIKGLQEKAELKLQDELQMKVEETSQQIEKVQELAKAELAAAIAKEKASQLEQIAEANLNIDALCMAFYARSEEARQSHSVHKLALGTLALEQALSSGSPIRSEVELLQKSLEGIDKDSLLELALSSLPEDVLDYGSDTRMVLKLKFNSLKETIRHFSLIPAGGGGILTHAVARVASSLKIKEDTSGDGIECLINRVESLIVDGDLSTAADTLEGGLHGSEAEEIATEWVKQARKRAVAEQTLRLLHACASSITFS